MSSPETDVLPDFLPCTALLPHLYCLQVVGKPTAGSTKEDFVRDMVATISRVCQAEVQQEDITVKVYDVSQVDQPSSGFDASAQHHHAPTVCPTACEDVAAPSMQASTGAESCVPQTVLAYHARWQAAVL
jgi:hypothetical protein